MTKFAWYVVVIVLQLYCASGLLRPELSQSHQNHAGEIAPLYKVVRAIEGLKDALPQSSLQQVIKIQLSFTLLSVVSVSDDIVEVAGWLVVKWHDYRLNWLDSPEYQNITSIHLSVNDLWVPDLALYNSVDTDRSFFLDKTPAPVIVSNDGQVLLVPPVSYKVQCIRSGMNSNLVLECNFKIGSWTYNAFQVYLHGDDAQGIPQEINLSHYKPRDGVYSDYQILQTAVRRHLFYYPCCREPFSDVTFKLILGSPKNTNFKP